MRTVDGQRRVAEVTMPDGAVVFVEAIDLSDGGASEAGLGDRFDFADVAAKLKSIRAAIGDALAANRPDELTVELGIQFVVKPGALTCMLVSGETNAALTVSMTWKRDTSGATDGSAVPPPSGS